jgi:hypothetical protein
VTLPTELKRVGLDGYIIEDEPSRTPTPTPDDELDQFLPFIEGMLLLNEGIPSEESDAMSFDEHIPMSHEDNIPEYPTYSVSTLRVHEEMEVEIHNPNPNVPVRVILRSDEDETLAIYADKFKGQKTILPLDTETLVVYITTNDQKPLELATYVGGEKDEEGVCVGRQTLLTGP